ncbi:MAG: hypothetical protein NWE91_01860 [Candidatus Bathyarchaeota archaeon]|nr:hypothetical protein [Candidatus Bathyarchaeota archaeon]
MVKKGVIGSTSARENTPKTGPRTIPIKIRNKLLGSPTFLNNKFAKKPMAIIAPTNKKTAIASAIIVHIRNCNVANSILLSLLTI